MEDQRQYPLSRHQKATRLDEAKAARRNSELEPEKKRLNYRTVKLEAPSLDPPGQKYYRLVGSGSRGRRRVGQISRRGETWLEEG